LYFTLAEVGNCSKPAADRHDLPCAIRSPPQEFRWSFPVLVFANLAPTRPLMHPHRPRWKKWLFAAVKLLVFGLLVWFMRDMLTKAVADLRKHPWQVRPAWLVLAGVCYFVGLMPVPIFWNRLMRSAGQDVGLFETIRAWWISQIFKYIPGKAMVLIVRTGMLRSPKVETAVVGASVFVETLTMMAVGSFVSFVILLTVNWHELGALLGSVTSWSTFLEIFANRAFLTTFAALGMFVGMGLPTWPPIMRFAIKVLRLGRLNPSAAQKISHVSHSVLVVGWLTIAVGWCIQGIGLWATLRSLGVSVSLIDLPINTAAVAMSTVAGFVSLIPGGAGIREVVQTELTVKQYGEGMALIAAVFLRIVMLVAELVISSILYLLGPRGLRRKLSDPGEVPAATTGG
jgi:uncharacterized membrane protein YbhN (UPF0104 family)